MNNFKTYTVYFPCGNLKLISSNIFNLRKEISKQLSNPIPDDNLIIFDAQLNVYSRSTLQKSQFLSEILQVQDANVLVQEWDNLKKLAKQMNQIVAQINEYQLKIGIKDSQIQDLEKESINYEKKLKDLRLELGLNQDKVKKLCLENEQIRKEKAAALEQVKQLQEDKKQYIEEIKLLKQDLLSTDVNSYELQNQLIIQEKKYSKHQSWIENWKKYDNEFLMKCKQNVKEDEKQIDMIRKQQQASTEFWAKQYNEIQQQLKQEKEENMNLRSQLKKQTSKFNESDFFSFEEMSHFYKEQASTQASQLKQKLETTSRELSKLMNNYKNLKVLFQTQSLSLNKAIQLMRFENCAQGCVQDLWAKNIDFEKLFQNDYQTNEFQVFEIEKHGDFANHFEKLEFFQLENCLKLVRKGQFQIKQSQNNIPCCESKTHLGYIREIVQTNNPPSQNNYLLFIKSKRQDQPYFIDYKDAITQSLNHIIVDVYLKEFLRQKNQEQADFKVATPYILKECKSELYFYCIGLEMGQKNIINQEFIQEFKNYISNKTKNFLEIGNLFLINNVMHDVVLYTKFGFLTELDKGQGGSPFQIYFQ